MSPIVPLSKGVQQAQSPQDPKMFEAAQAFEAIFLRDMIGAMRKANLGDDLFGSSGADQFRDMFDAKVADNMAQTKGIGIANLMVTQWTTKP